MRTLKLTNEIFTESEEEAKEVINAFRTDAASKGLKVLSAGYTYKCKKKKGEILAEAWVCKCVVEHSTLWEDFE